MATTKKKEAKPEPEVAEASPVSTDVVSDKSVVRVANPPAAPIENGMDGKTPVTPNNPLSKAILS